MLLALGGCAAVVPAQAQDFFSSLFGVFAPPPMVRRAPVPDGLPADGFPPAPPRSATNATPVAYCVRTCDGFNFPVAAAEGNTRSDLCSKFCPAADTKVFYGGSIDDAETQSGRAYADLPNAFRYRKEAVAGCTCNGKDAFGLAKIDLADDRTLRKGDIVVGQDGLKVVTGRDSDGRVAKFSPASPALRARLGRVPVVASE
jgi:hypothetical protein